MRSTITVLGGDLRQVYLTRMLLEDGNDVASWGLEQGGAPGGVPLNQALERNILILPLPVCRGGRLNLPLTDTQLRPEQLWPRLRYDQLLVGGMIRDLGPQLMADYGLTLLDYYDREEVQVASAVPTALAVGHTCKSLVAQWIPFLVLQKLAGDEGSGVLRFSENIKWGLLFPCFGVLSTTLYKTGAVSKR